MLNRIWDNVTGFVIDPSARVQHIEAHWSPVLGVVCGVVAVLGFPLTSLLARMTGDVLRPNEMQTLWQETVPMSVAYFFLANLVIYLASRLFGGRGNLFRYLPATGWAGLFAILWSLLLLPVLFVAPHMEAEDGTFRAPLVIATVGPLLLIFPLVILWFRYQVAVISVTLGLSYRRALVVFLILALPLFLIYDQVL